MQKVQLTAEELAKLDRVSFSAELCDSAGATQAVVVPVQMYREMLLAWSSSAFREEDLERARKEPGGYTTAEVLTRLRALEEQHRRGQ